MARFSTLILVLILSACAGTQPLQTMTFTTPNYTVILTYGPDLMGPTCVLRDAVLHNSGKRDLGVIYTELYVADRTGRTVAMTSINFPGTVAGGSAQTVHVDTTAIGGDGCVGLQMRFRGSASQ